MNAPFFVLELTSQCNINCLFCYNVWKEKNSKSDVVDKQQLSLEQITKLIDSIITELDLQQLKPSGFALAGGEPLLHPHIVEVASHIRSYEIPVNIVSNGILLSETKIAELKEAGVNQFEISLPALSPSNYRRITNVVHVEKVREAILNVKSIHPDAHLSVAVTVTAMNYHEISNIIELCYVFSVDLVVLNRFVPGGQGIANRELLELSHTQLTSVLNSANEMSGRCNIPVTVAIPVEPCIIPHKSYPNLRFGSCVCGDQKWTIDPQGNLRICEQSPEILGNLFSESITDLMNSNLVTTFHQDMLKKECHTCKENERCGGGCRFAR